MRSDIASCPRPHNHVGFAASGVKPVDSVIHAACLIDMKREIVARPRRPTAQTENGGTSNTQGGSQQ